MFSYGFLPRVDHHILCSSRKVSQPVEVKSISGHLQANLLNDHISEKICLCFSYVVRWNRKFYGSLSRLNFYWYFENLQFHTLAELSGILSTFFALLFLVSRMNPKFTFRKMKIEKETRKIWRHNRSIVES